MIPKYFLVLFLILAQVDLIQTFFGRRNKDENYMTKTHLQISIAGTYKAVTNYLKIEKGMTFDEYFRDDYASKIKMLESVTNLGYMVSNAKESTGDYIHCYGEQLVQVHEFLKSCKHRLNMRKDDMEELRQQLGLCLYTLQSFYSNTNWVEMNGDKVYDGFEKDSSQMAVAEWDDDTCEDMESFERNCRDNLIVTNKLTSGYHSRGRIQKPSRAPGSTAGKCSHGGPDDNSRELVAKCGMNKESASEKWSPHYHLHRQAAELAIEATKQFLIKEETGVLYAIGQDVFENIFSVNKIQPTSLTFAVDYTGSMSNDITQVKDQIIQLVTRSINSPNEPAEYILVLFNDPENLTTNATYADGFTMIQAVEDIFVTGGGDCPEYAADGMIQAIELSRPGSTVFVFTDASAKDESRLHEVVTAATDKNIKITSLLTGNCSHYFRKKRDVPDKYQKSADPFYNRLEQSGDLFFDRQERSADSLHDRQKRSADSFYDQVALSTGGEVYYTNNAQLGNILDNILEVLFPATEVIIDFFEWNALTGHIRTFVVDSGVSLLKISITGAAVATNVDIIYANGTVESYASSTANRFYTGSGEIIISIQNPAPDTYNIRCNSDNHWTVNITAQSVLETYGELLEHTSDGDLISVLGSVVIGNNYSVFWNVYNLGNGTCNDVYLVDTFGTITVTYSPLINDTEFSKTCSADIYIPDQNFQIVLKGTDDNGALFTRKLSTTYIPSYIKLKSITEDGDAVLNKSKEINYEVTNYGRSSQIYQVSLTDSHGFTLPPSAVSHNVGVGETVNGTFTLKPTQASTIVSYTIEAMDTSSLRVQQSITKKLVVTSYELPSCVSISSENTCGAISADCSSYTWNTTAQITFSGTRLSRIMSTGGTAVTLVHENITDKWTGPLAVYIFGSCCVQFVYVTAIDHNGYLTQCSIDLPTMKSSPESEIPMAGIVAGVVCSVVAVAVTLIVVRYYYYMKIKTSRISDSTFTLQSFNSSKEFPFNNIPQQGVKPDFVRKPIFRVSGQFPFKEMEMSLDKM